MRFFVFGATGLTGREVVRQLAERGQSVTAHIRPASPRFEQWKNYFRHLDVDISTSEWSSETVKRSLARRSPTCVFSLLGTSRKRGFRAKRNGAASENYSTSDVDPTLIDLTLMALDASVASGSHPRFVFLSTEGAQNERTRSRFLRTRRQIESSIMNAPVPWVIARPSLISGERDDFRPIEAISTRTRDRLLDLGGRAGLVRLRERYHSIDHSRLARALIDIAFDPEAEHRCFDSAELRARG